MAKIALILVLVTLAVSIQGAPTSYDDFIEAAKSGNWEQLQQLLNSNLPSNTAWKPVSFDNVRNLKPPTGGHVFGQAEYSFKTATNINGQTSEESGGHKVVNNDGKVQEFDFKP